MAPEHPERTTQALPPLEFAASSETVGRALVEIGVAAYMLDCAGEVVWMNRRAKVMLGDRVGHIYSDAVTPDTVSIARTAFTKKISGTQLQTHETLFLFAAGGERVPVEINAVAMRCGAEIVGVFGVISIRNPQPLPVATAWERAIRLTPRQQQVLRELASGASTDEIASRLALSRTTVRNYIARTLGALGTHTRLQAVVEARRRGMIN